MCSYGDTDALPSVGFPIRKSADRGSFAAPRSLSQLVTSFIGAWCQGIHPMPLLALIVYTNLISSYKMNRLLIPQQKYPSELVYSLKCDTFDCITLTKDILTLKNLQCLSVIVDCYAVVNVR